MTINMKYRFKGKIRAIVWYAQKMEFLLLLFTLTLLRSNKFDFPKLSGLTLINNAFFDCLLTLNISYKSLS